MFLNKYNFFSKIEKPSQMTGFFIGGPKGSYFELFIRRLILTPVIQFSKRHLCQ